VADLRITAPINLAAGYASGSVLLAAACGN
jgi:hypothetical protein